MIEYSKSSFWLAVRYMQNAFLRLDEAGSQGRNKPMDAFVAEFWASTECARFNSEWPQSN
jgi:hypothetical protein